MFNAAGYQFKLHELEAIYLSDIKMLSHRK